MKRPYGVALLTFAALTSGCGGMSANNSSVDNEQVITAPGNRQEMIFCDEVKRFTTVSDCDALTLTAKASEEGTAAFNVPPMVRGQETVLQLAISFRSPSEDFPSEPGDNAMVAEASPTATPTVANETAASPTPSSSAPPKGHPRPPRNPDPADVVKNLPGNGVPEKYHPLVGSHMRATLVGQGFQIVPVDPASQDLAPGGVTTWTWKVTPLRANVYTLTIKTVVEGEMADHSLLPLGSTTENKSVKVTIRWYHHVWDALTDAPAWIKLLTGLLLALAALAAAWWKFFRAAQGLEEQSDKKEEGAGGHGEGEPASEKQDSDPG